MDAQDVLQVSVTEFSSLIENKMIEQHLLEIILNLLESGYNEPFVLFQYRGGIFMR